MTNPEIIVCLLVMFIVYKAASWFLNRPPTSKEKAEGRKLMAMNSMISKFMSERHLARIGKTPVPDTKSAREPVPDATVGLPGSYRDQAKPSVQEQLDELKERVDAQDNLLTALVDYKRHQAHPVRLGPDEISDREIRELRVVAVGDPVLGNAQGSEIPYLDEMTVMNRGVGNGRG